MRDEMASTIYRGFEIVKELDGVECYAIYEGQEKKSSGYLTEEAAMEWVDAEKKRRHAKGQ